MHNLIKCANMARIMVRKKSESLLETHADEEAQKAIKQFLSIMGRKGGSSKSAKKVKSSRRNAERMNEVRWGKKYEGKITRRRESDAH